MLRRSLACALLAFAVAGCAPSFESGSKLKSLRVLAVKKDKPYARPGETVHLNMLLDDPRTFLPDGGVSQKRFSIGWLSGCENPSANSFSDCIDKLKSGDVTGTLGAAINTLDFPVTLSDHIIKDAPKSATPGQPPGGTALVFFAVCAGTLHPMSGNLGFGCVSPEGKTLGADDFVIGYTQIFAYEGLRNANPIVTGFEIDGSPIPVDCIGDDCVPLEARELDIRFSNSPASAPEAGVSADGGGFSAEGGALSADGGAGQNAGASSAAPPPSCPSDVRCFPQCTDDNQDNCDKHTVKLVVDPASAEVDAVAKATEGHDVLEQMWVNYYTDAGKLEHDVKLLNDATTGWNENHSADLRTPQGLGTFHVWAAAHDNRGGVGWARVTLATTSPY
jgi:hypothetical protein